ncbi:MAG: QueT transporter family protein [Bilifractor sp.]
MNNAIQKPGKDASDCTELQKKEHTRSGHESIVFLTQAAMIAAIYVVLTYVFSAISFGQVQIRIAEALTILPVFTPAAIPGLFVGCLIGNITGGAVLPDIIFGSLATLIGAVGTRMLRKKNPVFCTLPPILANTVIVPFVLRFAYGIQLPIPFMMLTVGIGEVVGCGVLGVALYSGLKNYRKVIFRTSEKKA